MAETFLDRIVATARADLAERKARVPLGEMRERAASASAPRDFVAAVRPAPAVPARLIAEVKRASPSKGLITERFDPVAQARAYEQGGAAAISVLTEPHFFQGSLDHLAAVRTVVSLPVLRKDFILDPYQVYEARAAGADAVLLLCSLLGDTLLRELLGLARRLGMEALVEAHDADEVGRAVAVGAKVIGINARDLRTFAVDTDVVRHLRPLVPDDRIVAAESGIFDALGATRARAWGANAILVGEALMRAADPAAKARELSSAAGAATDAFYIRTGRPFVKVCGLTSPEQVRIATDVGADAFGLVFAPMAPAHRRVTAERAREIVQAKYVQDRLEMGITPIGSVAAHTTRAAFSAKGQESQEGARCHLAIGVFVNESPATIKEIDNRVGFDAIQLSGDEPPEECAEVADLIGLPVLKTVRLRTPDDLFLLDAYALAGATLLLDTPKDGSFGGTGEIGDWALAQEAAKRWPIILSGGLTPENVADAIKTVQPRGVDVSSGVESVFVATPASGHPFPVRGEGGQGGRAKDPEKIARFIAAARAAQQSIDHT